MSSSMNLGVLSTTPNIINNNNNNNNEASLDKDNLICGNMNNILSGGNNCNNNNNNNVNNNNIQQISSSQLSHLNMSNNFDLSSPMIFRSMSDASAIRRNLQMNNNHNNNLASYQRQFANLYGPTSWSTANDQQQQQQQQQQYADLATIISPGNSLLSSMPSGSSRLMSLMNRNSFLQTHQNEFNSSSTVTTTSIDTSIASNTPAAASTTATINGQLRSNINVNNPNNNTVDEDDYDLNIVFDEIDALQHKGLNEPEDDNSTAPLQLLSSPTTNDNQSTTAVSTQQPSQTNAPTKQLSHIEIDGKIYKYDPELYDPADITLMNEKFSMNARYLRDFRCEQCPLFLQHKCTQHKPFTCFNWHFANQRRRRPLRKRDGTFNYSPDNYCIKYDDTTGFCPDGDDCPYLHRTAGDTERRYHLRYYKTGMCVYETDERGYCVKNGAHCAFAHGSHDLRMAVFDIREQQQQQQPTNGSNNLQCDENGQLIVNGDHHLLNGGCIANNINGCQSTIVNGQTQQQQPSSSLSSSTQHMYDKDRNAINEDPRWQNTAFVLAFYKTELCKRPPRVCRQGYACPQYHNNKDRRRSPKKFKYRSTPCPSVKQGDEWGDPSNCENQDDCIYCHTRTEQQFHPEIYKSTKCNDIQQSGHCPRGPFCAFAHSESTDEINTAKEFATNPNTELPPSIAANVVVVTSSTTPTSTTGKSNNNLHHHNQHHYNNTSPLEIVRANSYSRGSSSTAATANHLNGHNQNAMIIASSLPEHVEFNGFDLQPQHHLAQNTELNNSMKNNQNNNILGPIARPRSFSTSNTNTKTSPLIANWLESKNNLLNHKHQQQQQQSLFATASSCSSLFSATNAESMQNLNNAANNVVSNGPFIANFTFEQQQQFNSILNNNNNNNNTNTNNNHDLNFDELDNFVAKTSNAIENCHIQQQQPPSSSESFGSILRRGSYSFNESEPINIPRIATNNDAQQQHRSTSAAGFNISPPTVAAAATNSNQLAMAVAAAAASPIGSAFMPANNRQNSLPNNQTIFDQFVNGTNAATTAASAVANNQQQNAAAMSAALMEMQRLKEENNAAKNRIVESQEAIQQVVQFFRIQLNEAQKREKLYEKQRDEALSRLDLREKELIESSTFHKQRISELSSMSRNQLLQLKQKLSQDLSYIEEALKTAATTPTATSGNV